jgi:hypothetical protein
MMPAPLVEGEGHTQTGVEDGADMECRPRRTTGATPLETTIVIIIVGILLSVLMPAIGVMRERALGARCQQHLRAIGVASGVYMADYVGENWLPASELPGGPFWFQKLEPFVAGQETGRTEENFVCPRAPYDQRGFGPENISFGWNQRFLPFGTLASQVLNHGETICVADSKAVSDPYMVLPPEGELRLDARHLGSANVLFLSGNVDAMTPGEAMAEWPRYWDRE